jgi:hypothetical protein
VTTERAARHSSSSAIHEAARDALALRIATIAGGCLGAAFLASWAFLAAAHADDWYLINHVAGAWLGLVQQLDLNGHLYPKLFDGSNYGGTRFMPLPILLYAGAAKVSGEYLASGKIVSYALFVCLLVFVYLLLRRWGCARWTALAFMGFLAVCTPGVYAGLSIRGDTLSVLLQLGAVTVVARSQTRNTAFLAGALCALAIVAKSSALWGPAAIAAVLLLGGHRRRLVEFGLTLLAGVALLVGLFEVVSSMRLGQNVFGLAVAGGGAGVHGLLAAPVRIYRSLNHGDLLVLALGTAALVATYTGRSRRLRQADVYDLSFVFAGLLLIVIFSDFGAGPNHLLDVEVLALLTIGRASTRLRDNRRAAAIGVVALASLLAFATNMRRDLQATLNGRGYGDSAIARYVHPGQSLLSETPALPVSLGERPVVLDPFMYLRLVHSHPSWQPSLLRRINDESFESVVLLRPVQDTAWYSTHHFGSTVESAIARHYRLVRSSPVIIGGPNGQGLWVYRPRR